VGLLGTRFTMSGRVYPDALGTLGITVIVPTEADQADVDRIIFDELIDGVLEPRSRGRYVEVIDELESRGADAVALACTEIPLLVTPDVSPLPTLDSTRLLASAAFTRAIGATRTSRSR
jgi:aspartate racemase